MRRRRNSRGGIGRTVGMLLLAVAAAISVGGVWLWRDWRTPFGNFPKGGAFVEIAHGSSRTAIADQLASNGVIRSNVSFRLLCFRFRGKNLEAGEYLFDRPHTPEEVFRILAEGRVYLHVFTVPEGFTVLDIAEAVTRERLSSREAILAAVRDTAAIHDLAPGAHNLEGFLFPDTYKFARSTPPHKIAESMVERFREQWRKLSDEHSPSANSPLAIVTMASLVERETAVPEERPRIASVFYNRLKKGVALDCDPTVIYALRLAGKYQGSLSSADMRTDSPYNTYLHRGLPPGPIANPGEASLRAALAPEKTDYLYFVADAEGHHVFSRTLAEHNRNVARYRRRLATQAHEAAKSASAPLGASRQSP